ncbi:hypothetical protein Tco_0054923 [Tanacetum coccineum]
MKFELSHDIPFTKVETFAEKVRRIIEENENREKILRNLESEPVNTPLVNAIRKTLDYTRRLQELVSNKTKIEEVYMVKINARCSAVLQNELPPMEKDPGSFILPCAIGNTTVHAVSKGIVENVLVKIHNFIFPVDFIILDIIEVDKVLIILKRPMLAIAHAKIDVFRKKISLKVGTE